MLYLDSSALVKLFLDEPGSESVFGGRPAAEAAHGEPILRLSGSLLGLAAGAVVAVAQAAYAATNRRPSRNRIPGRPDRCR